MSKDSALMLLGLVGVLVPFTGFPEGMRTLFIILAGAGVCAIGCSMRLKHISERRKHNTFTESRGGMDDIEDAAAPTNIAQQ